MTADDELIARAEAALAEALALEPSAGFKAAVRRRIAEGPPRRRAALGWLAAAAALVLALAVAVLQHSRPVAVRAITAPTPAPPAMTEQADVPRAATAGAPAASRRRASRTPLPEVIVPAGEARRIEAYYAAVSRIEAAPALVAADELTIAPIEIEPLPDAGPGAGPAPGHGRGL